jgi:YD repeat-containing protein
MKTKIKLLLLLGLISVKVFSQNPESPDFQIPNFAAKSPEAAAFLKYGEYPVDLSTGVPNVSIPLYTIEISDYSLPITLNYHASGIKVDQEATWVGLGWNLNYGAQIILSVRDDIDENNAEVYNMPSDASLDYYNANNHPYAFNSGPIVSEKFDISRVKDVYSFSSPTANGDFYIRDNSPIDIVVFPPNAFKVEKYGTGFKITDAAGTVYTLTTFESSQRMDYGQTFGQGIYKSAWYVDEIKTINNDAIVFQYDNDGTVQNISSSQRVDIIKKGVECGCLSGYEYSETISPVLNMSNHVYTDVKKIHEIIFDNGNSKITFNRDNGREDIKNGIISFNNKQFSTSKLSTIDIKHKKNSTSSQFDYIKGFQLEYDYFNPDVGIKPNTKRLKLLKVVTLPEEATHEFVYNTNTNLPGKDSYSKDYFGYFNGKRNSNLIPVHHVTNPFIATVGAADRTVNEQYVEANVLKEIHYPSKGWTKFNYEGNKYYGSGQSSQTTEAVVSVSSGSYHPEFNYTVTADEDNLLRFTNDFTVNSSTTGIITWSASNNAGSQYNQILFHPVQYVKVLIVKHNSDNIDTIVYNSNERNGGASTNTSEVTQTLTITSALPPGEYSLVILCYGRNVRMYAELHYVHTYVSTLGAGLRVASIENWNHDNTLLTRKEFDYTDPINPDRSSGRLINPLQFDFFSGLNRNYNIGSCPISDSGALKSGMNFSIIYSISSNSSGGVEGNTVIYEYVKEKNVNFLENTSNGFTQYKFTTAQDLMLNRNIIISIPHKRGKELEVARYRRVGTAYYVVNKEVNVYIEDLSLVSYIEGFHMTRQTSTNFHEMSESPLTNPNFDAASNCGLPPGNVLSTVVFNKFKIAVPWYYLKSTQITESFYNQSNTLTGTIVTDKTYNYNNPLHMQLSSEVVSGAGITRETKYYYPHDAEVASEPGVATLKTKNRINTPLKTQTYEGSQKLSEQKTLYKDWGNGILLPEIVQAGKGTGELENRIIYNAVDNTNGKPLEMQLANGTKVCYIWGYNKSVPVVKIENSPAYSSIPSNLITAIQTATNTGATDATIYTLMDNLRNSPSLAGSMVTTYTYIPLKGVSSITDAKGDRTTYSYDGQGRLLFVKDKLGRILSSNEYHYKS